MRRYGWELLLVLALIADVAVNAAATPYFLDPYTLSDATYNFTEKAVIALAMALLIISGEIDISVAAILALASTAMGFAAAAGWPVAALVLTGLGVGAACGAVNGALVTGFGVPSIIATIGTLSLFRGMAYALLGDGALKSYPAGFDWFGQGYVAGPVTVELVLLACLAAVAAVVLHMTATGRRLYAIGSSPMAARMSGVGIGRHRFWLFVATGSASGLAALLLTSRLGSTRPSIAEGWELEVITMVILGGVAITGGAGSIPGVVLAAILMGSVTFGLGLLNIPGIVLAILVGALLIAVMAASRLTRLR